MAYRTLWKAMPIIIGSTVVFSVICAMLGHFGMLDWINSELRDEAARHRPIQFVDDVGLSAAYHLCGEARSGWHLSAVAAAQ